MTNKEKEYKLNRLYDQAQSNEERHEYIRQLNKIIEARNKYAQGKQAARQKAIDYQQDQSPKSWGQILSHQRTFEKLAKKYGLVKEFKENGII